MTSFTKASLSSADSDAKRFEPTKLMGVCEPRLRSGHPVPVNLESGA
jgi:hypothetical protein